MASDFRLVTDFSKLPDEAKNTLRHSLVRSVSKETLPVDIIADIGYGRLKFKGILRGNELLGFVTFEPFELLFV